MPIVLDGTNGITQADQFNSDSTFGFKNRIINGAMVIDQRNAGASVTQGTSDTYSLDRFLGYGNITSKFTMQQSSTAPVGFVNSVVITSSAATVVGSSDQYYFAQKIEGYNTADLGWGTANAKTVTLSFWARASVIGTYSVFLLNNGSAYSYIANYTISVADTFEYKTITIVAPTVGTWLTTNGLGIYLGWDLGSGSTFNQTAGSWQAANKRATSGSTQLVATSGATLYLTGVQLEVGSTATSFDYLDYGRSLIQCQRYLPAWRLDEDNPEYGFSGQAGSATGGLVILPFLVQTRTRPTGIVVSNATHFQMLNAAQTSGLECSAVTFNRSSKYSVMVGVTCASGLTAGDMSLFSSKNTSAVIYATGCEL